ncbi:LysR family transcriptional regulator [Maritimibacter sp. DP1N21-5]|uniref:LysR family transcriptional regulator n=1 Tax=Maritimibacter sp. DP1N21-5 TaxID=2836867 RepID=UPI001C43EFD1|nr:LysR substrate-binding domain-containing protein [Maritimibacter sp. DP1N21-5]MBV7410935.1 LysR family transcriptional regulator [Maritimibacter sp. DP1N21-5]
MQEHLPRLSARHVRVIRALSERRRLSDAADAVGLSQPAFSRALHDAEQRLDAVLFQRGWSGSEPTTMGDILIHRCQLIMTEVETAERGALGNSGPLRLVNFVRWRHLIALSAVVRHGSASAAAKALGISQPAVSQSLLACQDHVSPQLFTRRRAGLEPTDAARALAALWDRIDGMIREIPALMAATGDALVGRVSVGMLPFSGQSMVLDAFGEITRRHPLVHLVAVPGGYETLAEAMKRGEIDLIIGVLRDPTPYAGFVEEHLYHERYMMVARADHPVHEREVTVRDLAREQWIVAPHGTPIRSFFDRVFRQAGAVPPAQSAEMFSFSNAEQMIEASQSIAMLCYGRSGLARLRPELRPVDINLPGSEVSIGVTRIGEPGPAVVEFLRILRERIVVSGEV